MTKPNEMPFENLDDVVDLEDAAAHPYTVDFVIKLNKHDYVVVRKDQAEALWEGARMIIEGIDCFVPANRDDKKAGEQALFLQEAIALLKKGVGDG